MSEKMRFFKSGILLTLVGLGMRTVSMFFGAFISRTVGAEGTGLYTLVMTVYSFAVTFATSGISLTVTRLVASAIGEGDSDRVGRVMKGAVLYSFAFGSLATLGLYFGADLIGDTILNDQRTVISLKVLAFSLIPAAISSVFTGYFVGVKRVGFNAVLSVFCQAVKIVLTVALVIRLLPYGMVSAVVGLCIGLTLTEILGFLLILAEYLYDRRRSFDKTREKGVALSDVSKMALPLAFSAYVRSLLLNIEHILIPKKLRESGESTEEAYAHYGTLHGMALPLIIYPMSPLSSFAGLLVPEFAEDMAAGKDRRMSRVASAAINATLSYAIFCAVYVYAFSEELGYAVYNSYDAGYYISTLALVIPIMYLDHVTDSVLKGIGEHVFSMWVNISDSLLSVILVWLLIPRMGIMGYAVVILVMEGYNFLLSFIRLKKRISFHITAVRTVILPLASAFVGAYLSRLLFRFGGSSISAIWLALKILFGLSISTAVFSVFNLTTKKQLRSKNKKCSLEQ